MWSCNTNCRRLWRPRHNLSKLRCEKITIEQFFIACVAATNSTFNILAQASGTADYKTQHCAQRLTQHCRRLQLTTEQFFIACVAATNSKFNIQNSTLRFALRASRFTFASWHRQRRPTQSVQSLAAHTVPHVSRLSSYS